MPAPAPIPDDLATAISNALLNAWSDEKRTTFASNPRDVQPMFPAISRGLVTYLEGYVSINQVSLIVSMTASVDGATPVANAVINPALGITGI